MAQSHRRDEPAIGREEDLGLERSSEIGVESGQQPFYQIIMGRFRFSILLVLLVTGCEEMQPIAAEMGYTHSLGDFEVEQVSFVEETPGPGDGYDGGGHLKLSLTSTSQLALGYPTHWIGVASDYCPLEDDHKLLAFGYFGDGQSFWDYSEPKPVEKSADGLFRYEIYVVRSYPPLGKTHDDFGWPQTGPYARSEYDIVDDQEDLCLQFFGGDHYHVFARSSAIRVEYRAIRKAAIEAQMVEHP